MSEASAASAKLDENEMYQRKPVTAVISQKPPVKSALIVSPDNVAKGMWDILLFVFILYQAVIIPFRICFESDPSGFTYYLELTMDISFILDILVCFNCGYYSKG